MKDALESMKLAGPSNYVIWSYKVKMILMQEGLWKFIKPAANQRHATDMATSASMELNAATREITAVGTAADRKGVVNNQPTIHIDIDRDNDQ